MKKQEAQRVLELVERLSRAHRQDLADMLKAQAIATASVEVLEGATSRARSCLHCDCQRLARNGMAEGVKRHKCRGCSKTFNTLTRTPLTRLRQKGKWLDKPCAPADAPR